jgi:hypothetical protein
LSWAALKWLSGYQDGYAWILASVLQSKTLGGFLVTQIATQSKGLWGGWIVSFDHLSAPNAAIVGSLVGAVCLAGCVHRTLQKKFDGLYVLAYLAVLMLWPFSAEMDTSRFLFVVIPILLLQGLLFIHVVTRRFSSTMALAGKASYFLAIALIVFPADALIGQRLAMALSADDSRYAHLVYWYEGPNVKTTLERNELKIKVFRAYMSSWAEMKQLVPKDECIYSVDPTWLTLYTDRLSYYPPRSSTRDRFLAEATRCRYFYIAAYARHPYARFYPQDFLSGSEVVVMHHAREVVGQPVIGLLVKTPQEPRQK